MPGRSWGKLQGEVWAKSGPGCLKTEGAAGAGVRRPGTVLGRAAEW